ncbi:MAG: S-layer homology domain-containing protein, partial [Pyrinomonadaceae bacterium]
ESNYLNLPGLTGRREEVVLRNPSSQMFRSSVYHTGGVGVAQNVYGAVEITQVEYPELSDLNTLSPDMIAVAESSLLTNIMQPFGRRYKPDSSISRFDLATAFVRAGLVTQYVAAKPMFTDARDKFTRNAVESVQSNPDGRLFYDAVNGGKFHPNSSATRVVAAVAFVKAANLDSEAASTALSSNVADIDSIPVEWRGYIAVALERGFISLDGNRVNPDRPLTRIELARAMSRLMM